MKNNKFFKAMQKKLNSMTYGELYEANQHNSGKKAALYAWREGNSQNLDFPLLARTLYEDEVSDFLETVEEAGFKKFGFFAHGRDTINNITAFLKTGWKLTGTFEFDDGCKEPIMFEGLVFERD